MLDLFLHDLRRMEFRQCDPTSCGRPSTRESAESVPFRILLGWSMLGTPTVVAMDVRYACLGGSILTILVQICIGGSETDRLTMRPCYFSVCKKPVAEVVEIVANSCGLATSMNETQVIANLADCWPRDVDAALARTTYQLLESNITFLTEELDSKYQTLLTDYRQKHQSELYIHGCMERVRTRGE